MVVTLIINVHVSLHTEEPEAQGSDEVMEEEKERPADLN